MVDPQVDFSLHSLPENAIYTKLNNRQTTKTK